MGVGCEVSGAIKASAQAGVGREQGRARESVCARRLALRRLALRGLALRRRSMRRATPHRPRETASSPEGQQKSYSRSRRSSRLPGDRAHATACLAAQAGRQGGGVPRGGTEPAGSRRRPATVPKSGRFAACSRGLASDVPIAGRFSPCKYLRAEKRPENGSLDSTRFRGRADVFALEALRVAVPQTCPPAAWRMPRRRRRWTSSVPRVGATCGSRSDGSFRIL